MAEKMVVYNSRFWEDAVLNGRIHMLRAVSSDLTFDELRESEERLRAQWKLEASWHQAAQGKVPATLADPRTAADAFAGTARRENKESELAQLALFGVLHWNEGVVRTTSERVALSDDHFKIIMARPDLSPDTKDYVYVAQNQNRFYTSDELAVKKQEALIAAKRFREEVPQGRSLEPHDVVLHELVYLLLFPTGIAA